MGQVDQQPGIHLQRNALAVLRQRLDIPESAELRLPARTEAHFLLVSALQIGHRPQMHLRIVAVDDDRIAVFGERHCPRRLADHRDAHGAGDDDHVAGDRPLLQHEAAHVLARIVEQLAAPMARATTIASFGKSAAESLAP